MKDFKLTSLIVICVTIGACHLLSCTSYDDENYNNSNNEKINVLLNDLFDNLEMTKDCCSTLGNYQITFEYSRENNNIISLRLINLSLNNLPESINKLELESIYCFNTCINSLSGLSNKRTIKDLSFENCKFSEFPNLNDYEFLTAISLSSNQLIDTVTIDSIPHNLLNVNLCYNQISSLIIRKPLDNNIESLNLAFNNISKLDESIYLLSNLKFLNLRANPLTEVHVDKFKHLLTLRIDKRFENDNEFCEIIKKKNIQVIYY
ncbi:MAG: hypothetical protein K9J13_02950 [Saprospiraceae bacterium]|nr:hypothetical protein [Saprospiraceae bacterium]